MCTQTNTSIPVAHGSFCSTHHTQWHCTTLSDTVALSSSNHAFIYVISCHFMYNTFVSVTYCLPSFHAPILHVCIHVHVYVCTCTHIHTYCTTHVRIVSCTCTHPPPPHTHTHSHTHTNEHTNTHTHTHTHEHTHTHTHAHTHPPPPPPPPHTHTHTHSHTGARGAGGDSSGLCPQTRGRHHRVQVRPHQEDGLPLCSVGQVCLETE